MISRDPRDVALTSTKFYSGGPYRNGTLCVSVCYLASAIAPMDKRFKSPEQGTFINTAAYVFFSNIIIHKNVPVLQIVRRLTECVISP